MALSDLDLETKALKLQGSVALDKSYAPKRFNLRGHIVPATGDRVALPIGDASTSIARAKLDIFYDNQISGAGCAHIAPQLFSDEGHDGMQQDQPLI